MSIQCALSMPSCSSVERRAWPWKRQHPCWPRSSSPYAIWVCTRKWRGSQKRQRREQEQALGRRMKKINIYLILRINAFLDYYLEWGYLTAWGCAFQQHRGRWIEGSKTQCEGREQCCWLLGWCGEGTLRNSSYRKELAHKATEWKWVILEKFNSFFWRGDAYCYFSLPFLSSRFYI